MFGNVAVKWKGVFKELFGGIYLYIYMELIYC